MRITIETETSGDSRTMFRVLIDEKAVGDRLTAVQAQLVVGEIIERIMPPKKKSTLRVISPAAV